MKKLVKHAKAFFYFSSEKRVLTPREETLASGGLSHSSLSLRHYQSV